MSPFRIPVESLHKHYIDGDDGLLVNVEIICPRDFEEVISEEGFEGKIETIWALNIPLKKAIQLERTEGCNECLSTKVICKCSTCSIFSNYVCGKCVETGGHSGNHVVTTLEDVLWRILKIWEERPLEKPVESSGNAGGGNGI